MISPLAMLGCLIAFIIILASTRYVSLGSVVCAVLFPFVALLLGGSLYTVLAGAVLALLIVYRHIPNIRRLIAGNESKFSFKSKAAQEKK
jgi:glycerol-3-phosphate acyltransferase PlsY